jgi:hypothetical protein
MAAMDTLLAEQLADDVAALESDAILFRADGKDEAWVVDFYMRQQVQLDAATEAVKANAARLCRAIEQRRHALAWRYDKVFRAEADKRLAQEKKKKSFRCFFGVIGTRKTGGKPIVVIDDEMQAIAAAKTECPEAVKVKESILRKPLAEYMLAGGYLVGAHVETPPEVDEFYFRTDTPQLESDVAEPRKQLGTSSAGQE